MKKSIPVILISLSISAAQAIEIGQVESVYNSGRISQEGGITSNTINNIRYESSLTSDAHLASFDISTKTTAEAVSVLQQVSNGDYAPGYFSNYPSLPTTLEALDQLTAENVTLNDTAYQAHISNLVESIRYSGVLAYSSTDLSFQGVSDSTLILHDIATGTHYECDRANFDAQTLPAQQPSVCNIFAIDSFAKKFETFVNVSFKDNILLTDYQDNVTAYFQGATYTLPTSGSQTNSYRINNTSVPIISKHVNGDSEIFRLNGDGTISQLSISGVQFDEETDIQLNDTFMLVNNAYYGSIESSYCEYTITDTTISCNAPPLPLPFEVTTLENQGGIEEFMGYSPYISLGYGSEIITAFIGYQNFTAMPIMHDLLTGTRFSLTQPILENLTEILGADYIEQVRASLLEFLSGSDTVIKYQGMSEELEQEVINDLVAKIAVSAYENYIATGVLNFTSNNTAPASLGDLFLTTATESQFIAKDYIKTPLAKYSIVRDIEVSGSVTLPGNFTPEAGINVTLVDNEGNITNTQSDANGVFAITNPTSDNYEITFSYPNHVFECASVDISTGTLGSFEMLAGDFNNDGIINAPDWWMFRDRADHPTVDFDINNDGIVNFLDKEMLLENRFKRQCDL